MHRARRSLALSVKLLWLKPATKGEGMGGEKEPQQPAPTPLDLSFVLKRSHVPLYSLKTQLQPSLEGNGQAIVYSFRTGPGFLPTAVPERIRPTRLCEAVFSKLMPGRRTRNLGKVQSGK